MERLLTTTVERDGAEPVLLCSNTYDDLGRPAMQSLGGTAKSHRGIESNECKKLDKKNRPFYL